MDARLVGGMLIAAGAVLCALSGLSDVLAFGSEGFGWKQVLGVSAGVVAVAAGATLVYVEREQQKLRAGRRTTADL